MEGIKQFIEDFIATTWISKLFFLAMTFLFPIWELYLLLLGLVCIDYIMDFYYWFKHDKGVIKVWSITEPFITKIILYSIMTVSVHAVQQHLIKESFDMFKFIMAIPIVAELGGILGTVEKHTGIQVIDKLKQYIEEWIVSKK